MNIPASSVNFEDFVLDFMKPEPPVDQVQDDEEGEDEEEEYSRDDALDRMVSAIPANAVGIGTFSTEVENWTSWEISDRYYVIPWQGEEFDWALFRITWDDNWGRYQWEGCARVSGASDAREAGRLMVAALFEHWRIDVQNGENGSYKEFIESI